MRRRGIAQPAPRRAALTLIGLIVSAPLAAQQGEDAPLVLAHDATTCDSRALAPFLAEPWRRYSSDAPMGTGRIAVIDLGTGVEPRYHLLVVARGNGGTDWPGTCRILTLTEPGLALEMEIGYGSAKGRALDGTPGVTFSGYAGLRIEGETRRADAVIRVSMTHPDGETRLDALSIGAPWVTRETEQRDGTQ